MTATVFWTTKTKLDPRAWSTFGLSAKVSDNPIGQFGTGLKYAIAVCLRNGRDICIWVDGEEYRFTTATTEFRGKEFEQVLCNGKELPFTLDLGKHWELWQAYRELHCNTLDEGGTIHAKRPPAAKYKQGTVIKAELGDIEHNEIFRPKSKLVAKGSQCSVYEGSTNYIYCRGVRVYASEDKFMYTYDFNRIDLTEDRTLKFYSDAVSGIAKVTLESTNTDFIPKVFLHSKEFNEGILDYDWFSINPSEKVCETVQNFQSRSDVWRQTSILNRVERIIGKLKPDYRELTTRESKVVEKANEFLVKLGYEITASIVVITSNDHAPNTLAMADRTTNQIILTERVLMSGVKQVASTLLEEHIHLTDGFDDCTYSMQTFLFDKIISMGEELTGDIL